jgi:hypothetical protein
VNDQSDSGEDSQALRLSGNEQALREADSLQDEEGYCMYKPSRVTVSDGQSNANMEIERAQDIRKS